MLYSSKEEKFPDYLSYYCLRKNNPITCNSFYKVHLLFIYF